MTSRALLVESLTALEDLLVSAHYNRADDTMEMPAERYRQANGALTVLKQALADAARLDREEQAVFHMTAQQKTTLQRLLASFTADDPEALDSWFQRRGVTREAVLEALTAVVVASRVMTKHGPFPNCSSCGLPIDSGGFCSSKCAGGDAEMVSCTCSECASRVPETPTKKETDYRTYMRHLSTCLGTLRAGVCDCGLLQQLARMKAAQANLAPRVSGADGWREKVAKITRVEVIDHTGRDGRSFGRVYTAWDVQVDLSYQDGGRTLKVFVDERVSGGREKE